MLKRSLVFNLDAFGQLSSGTRLRSEIGLLIYWGLSHVLAKL